MNCLFNWGNAGHARRMKQHELSSSPNGEQENERELRRPSWGVALMSWHARRRLEIGTVLKLMTTE